MSAIINQMDRSLETLPNTQLQLTEDRNSLANQTQTTPSEYTLNQQSIFSSDVDNWMAGPDTENTGVQGSGIPSVQRSSLVTTVGSNGMWYLLAMVLPLFSVNHGAWRATPSTILYTAEVLFLKLGRACGHISQRIRHMAQNRHHRDIFATALDVVLVVYAIGFLVLSMYQTTFTGNL